MLATAAALLCVLLALPALASGRPREPFDFELAARSGDAGRPPASGRLAGLHTPRRFNLVGLRWRGPRAATIRLRARRPAGAGATGRSSTPMPITTPTGRGGERAVSSSDPLWVGSADAVQYRLSRPVGACASTS